MCDLRKLRCIYFPDNVSDAQLKLQLRKGEIGRILPFLIKKLGVLSLIKYKPDFERKNKFLNTRFLFITITLLTIVLFDFHFGIKIASFFLSTTSFACLLSVTALIADQVYLTKLLLLNCCCSFCRAGERFKEFLYGISKYIFTRLSRSSVTINFHFVSVRVLWCGF